MEAYVDIENAKTGKVKTFTLNVISSDEKNEIIFDISTLNNEERLILEDGINEEKNYTDIELFFIQDIKYPFFGPDYKSKIIDNRLILKYIKNKKS